MKKTMLLRIVSLTLTALILAACFTACKKEKEDTSNSDNGDQNNTSVQTESIYDANGYLLDSLPDDLDFGGREVNVLCWKSSQIEEFNNTSMPTDAVNTSFYLRNTSVATRTNTKINFIQTEGDNANQTKFVNTAMNEISAGGSTYDIIACYSMCGGTLMIKGGIQDLKNVQYLDFDKPWWSDTLSSVSTVKDRLYFASGDISGECLYNMMFMIYNNDIGDGFGIDDPRLKVKDGTWTMDEMYKLIANTYSDDGMDGKDEKDSFGLVISTQVLIDGFFYGCGYTFTKNTPDGGVELTDEFTGVKTYDLLRNLNQVLHHSNDAIYTSGTALFKAGRGMLGVAQASMFKDIKNAGWHYSILPLPKLDAEQDIYYSALGFGYTYYTIPVTAKDSSLSGAVTEALASDSYRRTTPQVFTITFKSRYSNDSLDSEMFDIIKSGIITDSARIFSSSFIWSESCLGLLRNCVINDSSEKWVSDITGYRESIQAKFDEIFIDFTE